MVETLIAGTLAGRFREQAKAWGLPLIGTACDAARAQALDSLVLYSPRSGPIRLADIAELHEAEVRRKSSILTAIARLR